MGTSSLPNELVPPQNDQLTRQDNETAYILDSSFESNQISDSSSHVNLTRLSNIETTRPSDVDLKEGSPGINTEHNTIHDKETVNTLNKPSSESEQLPLGISEEKSLSSHVVNFPNGNSSSAFPDLSAANVVSSSLETFDEIAIQPPQQEISDLDPLPQNIPPRNISPPKQAKSQERRNRAEEINGDSNNAVKVIPKFYYKYSGTEDFQTEIEEWFLAEDENGFFSYLKDKYFEICEVDWRLLPLAKQKDLLKSWLLDLESKNNNIRRSSLDRITYVSLGSFASVTSTGDQISQIKTNTKLLWENDALPYLYKLLIRNINLKVPENLYHSDFSDDDESNNGGENNHNEKNKDDFHQQLNLELFTVLTSLYFIIETHRDNEKFAQELSKLNPSILLFLIESIGRLRWGIEGDLPLRPMFLLFWKCMLCLFGSDSTLDRMKKYMLKKYNLTNSMSSKLVMASPLDYHAFRQDMMSRYPSYIPPSSALPKNLENARSISHFIEVPRPVIAQSANNALPVPTVHIATPAPSPPASPAIASGQKVRKSVFMTNQSFPFIHPTDDNIPLSIVEASELFHSRVHTTPSMIQLWEERDKFMQQERGWVSVPREQHEFEESHFEEVILERIEKLYLDSISHMNSFILVLLKFLLANASFSSSESHIDTYLSTHQYPGTAIRAKDIGLKAVSACLICLTNWFKVSHICKFEFLSTLLFDSRYYLLVFKYFYLNSPIEKALEIIDLPEELFFSYCRKLSNEWNSIEDYKYQDQRRQNQQQKQQEEEQMLRQEEPQGDENGPASTIIFDETPSTYSRRYFFTTINLLKVLRRIIRKKTQRIIVVAELPPDTLKKAMSIFQKDIWEIVLEIFKEQVPFNGRKWRSTNMDLVSAIYLYCKTKLRDDWLVGGDANSEVEDAQHQEVAIRALIQFYNERLKKEVLLIHANKNDKNKLLIEDHIIKVETENDDDEPPDFFTLELDALALDNASL